MLPLVKARNINIDIVKCVAVAAVVSVHFFLNSGFYDVSLHGYWGALASFMRTMFMVCVPLFLIATGYLMKNKVLETKYYIGVLRTVLIYIFISIACIIFRKYYLEEPVTIGSAIKSILDYSGCGYAWYIEMYLGLFLIIPFLNGVYRTLETKRNRQILLLTFVAMVALPSVLNFKFQIMPAWWVSGLYPLMYYYVGSYLRDYPIEMKKAKILVLFFAWVLLWSVFNYYLCINSKGNYFGWHAWTGWGSLENLGSSILLFAFIMSLKMEIGTKRRFFITKISKYSLGIYLSSWIFDNVFYPILEAQVGQFPAAFPYFVAIVPCVFICSACLSAVLSELAEHIALPLEERLRNRIQA